MFRSIARMRSLSWGGAQNTNEECYLFQKAARLLGTAFVEHQARL